MKTKNIKHLFLLLIIGLFAIQCKKTELPDVPQDSSPVFNIDGTLGETAISLHAGQQDAFMHTSVEQLNNIHLYSGELSNGQIAFKVQFFPRNVDIPSLYNDFTEMESYNIAQPFGTESLLTISLSDFPNSDLINKISWTVDEVEQSESTLKIYEPGKYLVCGTFYFNDGKIESICNSIIVGYKLHVNYKLDFTLSSGSVVAANIIAPDNAISKINWYIDNVYQSNEIDFHPTSTPDKFNLKAKVEFENGVVGTREIFINKLNPSNSIIDFTSLGQKSSLTWDNTVLFTIVRDGQTFTSIIGPIETPHFNIDEISDFKVNSKGNKVKLVNGTLKTQFKNTISGEILSGDFKIELGVAY